MEQRQLRIELVRYVRKITGHLTDAEDIVQDVMLTGLEKAPTLRDEAAYRQWLFRIARNKAIDWMKSRQKETPVYFPVAEQAFSLPEDPWQQESGILRLAARSRETYDTLRTMFLEERKSISEIKDYLLKIDLDMGRMKEEYIETLLLFEFQELSLREIADRTGVPLPTVKSRLQRGRQKIRDAYFKCCDFEFDTRGGIIDYTPAKK